MGFNSGFNGLIRMVTYKQLTWAVYVSRAGESKYVFWLVILQERRSLSEVGVVEKMNLREIRCTTEYPIWNLACSRAGSVACCCE